MKFDLIKYGRIIKKVRLFNIDKKNINVLIDRSNNPASNCLYMVRNHVLARNIFDVYRVNFKNPFSIGISVLFLKMNIILQSILD